MHKNPANTYFTVLYPLLQSTDTVRKNILNSTIKQHQSRCNEIAIMVRHLEDYTHIYHI